MNKKQNSTNEHGKRTKLLRFLVNDQEFDIIEQKQKLMGAVNLSVYLRRMAMEGYVLKLDLPELKGILSQMHRVSSNINQITKRFNATGRLYPDELAAVQKAEEEIWKALRELLIRLSELP